MSPYLSINVAWFFASSGSVMGINNGGSISTAPCRWKIAARRSWTVSFSEAYSGNSASRSYMNALDGRGGCLKSVARAVWWWAESGLALET